MLSDVPIMLSLLINKSECKNGFTERRLFNFTIDERVIGPSVVEDLRSNSPLLDVLIMLLVNKCCFALLLIMLRSFLLMN
jgi:hypothetical protein